MSSKMNVSFPSQDKNVTPVKTNFSLAFLKIKITSFFKGQVPTTEGGASMPDIIPCTITLKLPAPRKASST